LAGLAPRRDSIATEIELKLAARLGDLPTLTRLLEMRAQSPGSACETLVSTYFDTPDRALAAQGITLRVRERDGEFVQTVKSGVSGDRTGLVRGEWEDRIDGPLPDTWAPQSGHLVPAAAVDRLVPLFRTEVDRKTVELHPGPRACIEAAIDRGRIQATAADAGEPICEVELELKRGHAASLYDVALELLAVAPVRLELRSKAERGYRLAGVAARPVDAVHAAPVDLDPSISGHEALRRIGRACVDQIVGNEAAVRAGMVDGVHQMRVGVRRLRAILAAFGAMLPDDQRRWASGELRWLANALGAARNFDVFKAELVAPARQAIGDIPGITSLIAATDEKVAIAYADAAEALDSTRYAGLILRLLRWLEASGWRRKAVPHALDGLIGDVAAEVLERRRQVVKHHSKGFAGQSPEKRHELRIALKKLRYAMELLGGLYEAEEAARFTKRVKQLQDDLGQANDLQVGRGIVEDLARAQGGSGDIAHAGEAVLAWHGHRLVERTPELSRHLARLLDSEPFWSH
jgi:triphosphatase